MATIVIPAHNESSVIGRLLSQLLPDEPTPGLSVIVVANGCTDNTAEIARAFGDRVRVRCLPEASKSRALVAGDQVATGFPRIYLDADVELRAADVRVLEGELAKPGVLAAAPERIVVTDGCPWPVRWYYDIWSRLPEVRLGLFGRGVVAVSEAGHERIAALPGFQADDLVASLCFRACERSIVPEAKVLYHPPRKVADLLRRRIRAVTGVAQVERSEHAPRSAARTRPRDLLVIVTDQPRLLPRLGVFLAVTVLARLAARPAIARGDYTTWRRDESSRVAAGRA